jgi:phosphoglycerate dehydrogenase-like enzyme
VNVKNLGNITVVSQLEDVFNDAVRSKASVGLTVIERGAPDSLPHEADVLVAAPWIASGDVEALARSVAPAGWPFNLKWIQLLTSGTDMYPAWFLNSVPVSTSRGAAAESIAEFVLASLLGAVRGFPEARITDSTAWRPSMSGSFYGSSVGVVGFGPIGHAIASKCLALGAKVSVLRQSAQPLGLPGAELATDLKQQIASSDHLVLAAPVTHSTRRMVDRAALSVSRMGLNLVNVGRGELVDDAALLWALGEGIVSRAILDVTSVEPLPSGHPFYSHPRVYVTPHIAAVSARTRLSLAEKFVENLQRFQAGTPLLDVVNGTHGHGG